MSPTDAPSVGNTNSIPSLPSSHTVTGTYASAAPAHAPSSNARLSRHVDRSAGGWSRWRTDRHTSTATAATSTGGRPQYNNTARGDRTHDPYRTASTSPIRTVLVY